MRRIEGERLWLQKMRASSISLVGGLAVPVYEREDKDTRGGVTPSARPHQAPFIHSYIAVRLKPASFRRTSFACQRKIPDSPKRDFSPVPASCPQRTRTARTKRSISQIPAVVGKKIHRRKMPPASGAMLLRCSIRCQRRHILMHTNERYLSANRTLLADNYGWRDLLREYKTQCFKLHARNFPLMELLRILEDLSIRPSLCQGANSQIYF